jgi:hypothetical protein
MRKIILCRIVWAKTYTSRVEEFYAGNMRWPGEFGDAAELQNFKSERGRVYGFVQLGRKRRSKEQVKISLKKIGGARNDVSVKGVTVVWVALSEVDKRPYVVGWYKNAEVFAQQQKFSRDRFYNFSARAKDAKLLPEDQRMLKVPTAKKKGDPGFLGMRNWFYPTQPQNIRNYRGFLKLFDRLVAGKRVTRVRDQAKQEIYKEGERVAREILVSARNPKLVADAKLKYGVKCKVCRFDFASAYGSLGRGFIEVHHLKSLATRKKRRSTIKDVTVLCANCHRMVHKLSKPISLSTLRRHYDPKWSKR